MHHRTTLLLLALAACSVGTVRVRQLESPTADRTTTVTTPVRAHLIDGTTVHYPGGVTLANGVVTGNGRRVGLKLESGWVYADGLTHFEVNERDELLMAGYDPEGQLTVALQVSRSPFREA